LPLCFERKPKRRGKRREEERSLSSAEIKIEDPHTRGAVAGMGHGRGGQRWGRAPRGEGGLKGEKESVPIKGLSAQEETGQHSVSGQSTQAPTEEKTW